MTHPLGILVAIACLAGAIYALKRPQWVVLILIVFYPLEQVLQSYFPVLRATPWILNVSVGGLAGFAILHRFLKRETLGSGFFNGVFNYVVPLYALSWLGLLWTPSAIARDMMVAGVPYVALFLVGLPLLMDDLPQFRRLMTAIMVIGTAISLLVMFNPQARYASGRLALEVGAVGRFTNPLALATLGGVMTLTAVMLRPVRYSGAMTALRVSAFVTGLGLAVTSGSRGQVLAVAIVAVLFYPVARRVRNTVQFLLTGGGLIVMTVALMFTFQLFVTEANRARWDVTGITGDIEGRYEMARLLFTEWANDPASWVLGLGTNAFTAITTGSSPYVHNLLVEVLCELGLVGGIMMTLILFITFRHGRWLVRTFRDDPGLRSTAALLGALAAYALLLSLKQGTFAGGDPNTIMWWIMLARIGCHEQRLARAAAPEWDEEDATLPEEYALAPAG
jgi:hypothetical protein